MKGMDDRRRKPAPLVAWPIETFQHAVVFQMPEPTAPPTPPLGFQVPKL
jgi:hypothetical protein